MSCSRGCRCPVCGSRNLIRREDALLAPTAAGAAAHYRRLRAVRCLRCGKEEAVSESQRICFDRLLKATQQGATAAEKEATKNYLRPLEALPLYEKALKLWSIGINNYTEISRIIQRETGERVHPGLVRRWVLELAHPLGKCNRIVEGPDLAYVITSWLGDGGLARCRDRRRHKSCTDYYHYVVKLQVTDYEFASEFGSRLPSALGATQAV